MILMCEVSHTCTSCAHIQKIKFRDHGGGITLIGDIIRPHECVKPVSNALYASECFEVKWQRYYEKKLVE